MKKWIAMLLIGIMVFAGAGSAFAQEPEDILGLQMAGKNIKLQERQTVKVQFLKEFKEEIHQINALRAERHRLAAQVIEKQDVLLDLYIKAKEEGNQDALAAAKEIKVQIQGINKEIKELHKQVSENRKAFKEAIKNRNKETAKKHVDQIIVLKQSINSKIQNKIDLLEETIDIL